MIFSVSRRGWPGLAAVSLAWFLWPVQPAEAQSPCTGAAGERMVGLTPPGVGMSQVPLCVNDGAGGGAMPQMARSYYAAIAWHPDAADIWIDGGYSGPGAAEDVAIAACNRVMGSGCTSTGEWSNSSMAIIRDRFGVFYNAWLGNGNGTRQRVLDDCTARQLVPCEVVRTVNARQDRRWPGAEARKIYAVGAWVSGREGYDPNSISPAAVLRGMRRCAMPLPPVALPIRGASVRVWSAPAAASSRPALLT